MLQNIYKQQIITANDRVHDPGLCGLTIYFFRPNFSSLSPKRPISCRPNGYLGKNFSPKRLSPKRLVTQMTVHPWYNVTLIQNSLLGPFHAACTIWQWLGNFGSILSSCSHRLTQPENKTDVYVRLQRLEEVSAYWPTQVLQVENDLVVSDV